MKAEEKAKELFYSFLNIESEEPIFVISTNQAKQCALICVNEMIVQNGKYYLHNGGKLTEEIFKKENAYLFELKSEIEKL